MTEHEQGATPRTDKLVAGIQARQALRGFYVPEDFADFHDLCRMMERELAALSALPSSASAKD